MNTKHIALIFLIGLLLVAGCGQQAPVQVRPMMDDNHPHEEGTPDDHPHDENSMPMMNDDDMPMMDDESSLKEFDVIAKQFEFDPGTITVNEGDTVLLHITSTDVAHGIGIPDFGVSAQLPVGETVDVQFVADKTGTFEFKCSVFCGSGHKEMTGTLVVQ